MTASNPPVDPADLLELAVHCARAAGRLLVAGRASVRAVDTKTSPTDVVTQMDLAAERTVIELLASARRDDGVLAEEGGDRPGSSGVRWVLDPLDGTVNYLYGIGHYAVSLAAEVAGEVTVGVVHDPQRGETFTALRGRGAWLDGAPIACSRLEHLGSALVATGFGYAAARRAGQGRVAGAMLPLVRDLRRMGAAALDLAWVAMGRLDGYFERGLAPWDLAAGALIATEAGARVGGLAGRPAGADLVVAAGPGIYPELLGQLTLLAADCD